MWKKKNVMNVNDSQGPYIFMLEKSTYNYKKFETKNLSQ